MSLRKAQAAATLPPLHPASPLVQATTCCPLSSTFPFLVILSQRRSGAFRVSTCPPWLRWERGPRRRRTSRALRTTSAPQGRPGAQHCGSGKR